MNTNNDDSFNINLIDNLFYLCTNTFSIYILDNLIQYISTSEGRWYKIHFVINFYTFYHLYDKVINLIIDSSNNYIMYDDTNNLSMNLMNYHLSLHIYHIIFFKNLNFWDYFHHIIFAFFGIIPGMLFINSNQLYFQMISGGGIPGMIEYGSLILVKHNIINKITQKRLNVFLYIFIRLPLCIMGSTYNMIAYNNGYISDSLWITLYLNILMYLNGTIFTYLTCNSYYKHINRARLLY
tara:strand:- start:85 stop:798 length:714 start_codon:yes stop_codon:yes gene_type:complete